MDQVRPLELRPGPVIAERRHARRDKLRKARIQRGVVQPEHLIERAAARVEQHVGAAEQPQQVLAAGRALQVEHDRFLVAVVVPEEQRALRPRLVVEKRPDPPRRVAFRRLDLDHLRAEPGKQQPGIFGALVGDLDHPKTGQHARPGISDHLARSPSDRDLIRHASSPFPSRAIGGASERPCQRGCALSRLCGPVGRKSA